MGISSVSGAINRSEPREEGLERAHEFMLSDEFLYFNELEKWVSTLDQYTIALIVCGEPLTKDLGIAPAPKGTNAFFQRYFEKV
jgi:hypothetical protein